MCVHCMGNAFGPEDTPSVLYYGRMAVQRCCMAHIRIRFPLHTYVRSHKVQCAYTNPLPERTHTTLTLHSTGGLTGRAAHALQVLLGLSDADLGKILMDPIAAIRREFQR